MGNVSRKMKEEQWLLLNPAWVRPGIFQIGELCVFAHHFMRRSEIPFKYFNKEILGTLHQIAQDSSVNVRVRLDPDMVGLADTVCSHDELDYWYGRNSMKTCHRSWPE